MNSASKPPLLLKHKHAQLKKYQEVDENADDDEDCQQFDRELLFVPMPSTAKQQLK